MTNSIPNGSDTGIQFVPVPTTNQNHAINPSNAPQINVVASFDPSLSYRKITPVIIKNEQDKLIPGGCKVLGMVPKLVLDNNRNGKIMMTFIVIAFDAKWVVYASSKVKNVGTGQDERTTVNACVDTLGAMVVNSSSRLYTHVKASGVVDSPNEIVSNFDLDDEDD